MAAATAAAAVPRVAPGAAPEPEAAAMNVVVIGHVDHGKSTVVGTPAARHRRAAPRQDRPGAPQLRTQRQAVRVRVPDRRPAGRTGAGHHHRCRAGLLPFRETALHHHRRARTHRVPEEHDLRRRARRSRDPGDRRPGGGARELTPARLHGGHARHPPTRGGGQQDGPGGLRSGHVRSHPRGIRGVPARDRGATARLHSGERTPRRQPGGAVAAHAVVRRRTVAAADGCLGQRRTRHRAGAAAAGAGHLQVPGARRRRAHHRRHRRQRQRARRRHGGVSALPQACPRAQHRRVQRGCPAGGGGGQRDRHHPQRGALRPSPAR